ncbi:hypothetical protein FRC06_001364 [Ceratobasidium sp. 370]|nr:hypothetical protein FRC06_001364 [Ceratobasidium sp. 370]
MVWIVSPLNFIENQQCEQFRVWGLHAVGVNASTITPQLLEDIKSGRYQVIISSPEAYHDSNKLRPALLSLALKDRFHISVFDEAHCIVTWETFRNAYACCGDLRPLMLLPENCPIIAATATASPSIKEAVKHALKMRKGFHLDVVVTLENLGNFCNNMTHTIFRMTGGQKSYHEVAKLLPEALADLKQTIIFVNDYRTAHAVADSVRTHYGLSGKDARTIAPVYHSLKDEHSKRHIENGFQAGTVRVLTSTEALTMGANFPNVEKVINYLVPRSHPIWLQGAGRSGRKKGAWAEVVIMATPHMLRDAIFMCKENGIDVSAELLDTKLEDDEESDSEDIPVAVAAEEADVASVKTSKGRYQMTIGMAEYLVTE